MIKYKSEVKAVLVDALASDVDVARAAWVSFHGDEAREKDPKAIEGLINFLWREKHTSPFEHGIFKFYIDCPIETAREFMRHRTFSFNEVSGRYKKLDGTFFVPPRERPLTQDGKPGSYTFLPGTNEQYVVMRNAMERSYKASWEEYEHMLDCGIAKEVARKVLPVGIHTQFYASVDPLNLMKFLTLRNDKHAMWEIRQLAVQMEAALEELMPLTYKAYNTARNEQRFPKTKVTKGSVRLATTGIGQDEFIAGKPNPDYVPEPKVKEFGGEPAIEVTPDQMYDLTHPHTQNADDIARGLYPENHPKQEFARGGLVTDTIREPAWAIDSYVPKHRAGDVDAEEIAKRVADLVKRTDRFGRRKLEK